MYIHDDHRHYGSALIQIAEHPKFTAINAYVIDGQISRCGFCVNNDIGVYLRYRSKPRGERLEIYRFRLSQENLDELKQMRKRFPKLFVALVCVEDREICCLPYCDLESFVRERRKAKGHDEPTYVIEVHLEPRQQFRVWISKPGKKGRYLLQQLVPRSHFPQGLFEPEPAKPNSGRGSQRIAEKESNNEGEFEFPSAKKLGIRKGDLVTYDDNECEVVLISSDGTNLHLRDEQGELYKGIGPDEVELTGHTLIESPKETEHDKSDSAVKTPYPSNSIDKASALKRAFHCLIKRFDWIKFDRKAYDPDMYTRTDWNDLLSVLREQHDRVPNKKALANDIREMLRTKRSMR